MFKRIARLFTIETFEPDYSVIKTRQKLKKVAEEVIKQQKEIGKAYEGEPTRDLLRAMGMRI